MISHLSSRRHESFVSVKWMKLFPRLCEQWRMKAGLLLTSNSDAPFILLVRAFCTALLPTFHCDWQLCCWLLLHSTLLGHSPVDHACFVNPTSEKAQSVSNTCLFCSGNLVINEQDSVASKMTSSCLCWPCIDRPLPLLPLPRKQNFPWSYFTCGRQQHINKHYVRWIIKSMQKLTRSLAAQC